MPPAIPPLKTAYRGRFAPSPSGPLHWGSLATALLSWVHARQHQGEWLVRIEDLDPPREIPGMAEQHLAHLHCYGLRPDGEVLWQSQRSERYRQALQKLIEQGQAFECRCSRSDLAAMQGVHRRCVNDAPPDRPAAIRLRLPDTRFSITDLRCGVFSQELACDVGDTVLRRSDGLWAYQLAVVVDDAAQGITHVVRGEDLLDSTPRQRYLQRCLGLPEPQTLHLPLLLDAQGRKLSKSEGASAPDPRWPLESLKTTLVKLGIISGQSGACRLTRAASVPALLDILCADLQIATLVSPPPEK